MSDYIRLTNDGPEIYSIGKLRRDNPNTSFPKRPTDEILVEWGVYPLLRVNRPIVDYTKNVTETAPQQIDGVWTQCWSVSEASVEEVKIRTQEKAQSVRSERDHFLQQTDWMALSDNTMTSEWSAYRQALRDITDHANFPWLDDADWPVKPE